ncbi:MAG: hypothetical protein JO319_18115 [Acidobacteriaceae bacterium]|nr:hypothetical protein [Acidobacteriaceae bacterium]
MTLNRLRQNRLLLQLLFTLVAAASLAAISILVITDAIRSAERVVVGERRERWQGGDLSYAAGTEGACFIVHLPRN